MPVLIKVFSFFFWGDMQTLIQAPAFVYCELHFQNPHMHIINTVDYGPFIQSSLALRN